MASPGVRAVSRLCGCERMWECRASARRLPSPSSAQRPLPMGVQSQGGPPGCPQLQPRLGQRMLIGALGSTVVLRQNPASRPHGLA